MWCGVVWCGVVVWCGGVVWWCGVVIEVKDYTFTSIVVHYYFILFGSIFAFKESFQSRFNLMSRKRKKKGQKDYNIIEPEPLFHNCYNTSNN